MVTEFLLVEYGIGWEGYGEPARDAFRRNLISTDYTLCARGGGNWSIRTVRDTRFRTYSAVYETLTAFSPMTSRSTQGLLRMGGERRCGERW